MLVAVTNKEHRPASLSAEEPSLPLERDRKEYFDHFPTQAPSNLGQPSEFAKLQQRTDVQIFCNRPRTIHSIPITLLHPAFGKFVHDCEHYTPDRETTAFVLAFAEAMCEFYSDEQERTEAVRNLIWAHFRIKLEPAEVADTRFVTDGHASVGYNVYLNTEGKNELGSTLADPSVKSVIYGHHHVHKVAGEFPGCRFPCLHMYYFGKIYCFSCGLISD